MYEIVCPCQIVTLIPAHRSLVDILFRYTLPTYSIFDRQIKCECYIESVNRNSG